MTKLVLESVDTKWDINKDKILIVENYIPADPKADGYDEDAWDIFVDGIVSYARHQAWIRPDDFERRKRLWKIRGIPVRNARGDNINASPNPKA